MLVRVHPALDELEGDALLELPVGALGEVHDAHAAPAQLAHHPVGADRTPGWVRLGRLLRRIGEAPALELHEARGRLVGAQQGLDLLPERGIAGAALGQPSPAVGRRDLERLIEQPVGLVPAVVGARRHAVSS